MVYQLLPFAAVSLCGVAGLSIVRYVQLFMDLGQNTLIRFGIFKILPYPSYFLAEIDVFNSTWGLWNSRI